MPHPPDVSAHPLAHAWSAAARSVWAKTDAQTGQWFPLVRHLEDAAAVAERLWDEWLPRSVRDQISSQLPGGDADGRILCAWAAGTHDIGKCSRAFAVKLKRMPGFESVLDDMARHGMALPEAPGPGLKPHCRVGQVAVIRWLQTQQTMSKPNATTWASTTGAHHGLPPTVAESQDVSSDFDLGTGAWETVRAEILDGMSERTGASQRWAEWHALRLSVPAQVLVAGLVVVADWLSSDTSRFPYDDGRDSHKRASTAFDDWELPSPWAPMASDDDMDQLLHSRFPALAEVSARPVQRAAVEAARSMSRPGMLVVEAGTGDGKTEAALLAAETIAARFGCGGVLFALPTMATADGVLPRVKRFFEMQEAAGPTSFYLAHSKAGLNDDFRGMVRDGRFHGVYDDRPHSEVVVTSWLNGRRKGLLANGVVGTIDQLLFGALRARHLPLRHLALVGKVVILDEVHAADDFMRAYLKRALEWLGRYGTPVVMLSATLPPSIRQELVDAYCRGAEVTTTLLPENDSVPRLTLVDQESRDVPVISSTVSRSVTVECRVEGDSGLWDEVCAAAEAGACVGVIHDTVSRAQATYLLLRDRLGDNRVRLVHSRFLARHRLDRETWLRDALGPPGSPTPRPEGLVLVGTQVLEQSLDIDLDLLVTDIAPIDLVLQRAGRLHRHLRGPAEQDRPAAVRTARLLITGFTPAKDAPPELASGPEKVYGTERLLAALVVLQPHLEGRPVQLPQDGPGLVRVAYDSQLQVPPSWAETWAAAQTEGQARRQDQEERAKDWMLEQPGANRDLRGWSRDRTIEPDDSPGSRAAVRDIEDSLEVILIQEINDELRPMPSVGLDGVTLPTELGAPDDRTARRLAECTVTLPGWVTARGQIDRVIEELESRGNHLTGWQQSRWLRGQLVLPLSDSLETDLAGWLVRYDLDLGLQVARGETA